MNYSTIEGCIRQSTNNKTMTNQTPFESEGPITYGDIQLAKMTGDFEPFEPEPHTRMNRHEKLEFLGETTHFKTNNPLLQELVSWLTDDDFNQFYEDFCQTWDICKSHEELDARYGS